MNASQFGKSSRRAFLARSSLLGAAALLGLPRPARAEPPPETTKIRIVENHSMCLAPQYVAQELLRLEGFSDVEYVKPRSMATIEDLAEGRADLSLKTAPFLIHALDTGPPLVLIAGLHAGCYELFANERIKTLADLKGKTVAISAIGSSEYIFIASMLAYLGMDPQKDIQWATMKTTAEAMRLFAEGKADAFLAFPPEPQVLRAKKIGRVIVNTKDDRPWSQYFCCMVAANQPFVRKNPIATKRALRALLKAADICAQQPERAARNLVSRGRLRDYELALEVLKDSDYRRWRDTHPEDTLRFHALRLHEVGMIKSSPQKIIAQGTDWRFLNELKKELKA